MPGYQFKLPEPPSANRWWRMGRGKKGVSHMHLSPDARQYKTALEMLIGGQVRPIDSKREWPLFPEPAEVKITVDWWRGPIRVAGGKGLYYAGDLDKRLGILLDALQGLVYKADSQVAEIRARRFNSPTAPGFVMVEISDVHDRP